MLAKNKIEVLPCSQDLDVQTEQRTILDLSEPAYVPGLNPTLFSAPPLEP